MREPTYQLAPDAVLQIAGDEALLLKLTEENMYALNASGAAVVQQIAAGHPVNSVIRTLTAMFDGDPAALAQDVHDLVEALAGRGLLVTRHDL
jgi:hypothetical protein